MDGFTTSIVLWLNSVFHNPNWTTILISMIPMIETRGAITIGINMGMNPWIAYVLSCLSALIVCPILLILLKPILNGFKKTKWFQKLGNAVEMVFKEKAEKIDNEVTEQDKKSTLRTYLKKMLGIYLFVALPLPLTGVWTGTAVAVFVDLKYRYSVPVIILGNFTAGLIITLLNIFLADYSVLILLVLGVFMLISLLSFIIGFIIKYKKQKAKFALEKKNNE
ncbi:MAG: small multi-drug export protein [Clostridia bacterium]